MGGAHKTRRFMLRLAPEILAEVDEYAARNGLDRTATVNLCVAHGLRMLRLGERLAQAALMSPNGADIQEKQKTSK